MHVIKLCKGEGNGINRACLLSASNIVRGYAQSLDCNRTVDVFLQGFIPITNDAMSNELRSEIYSPFIWEINGTYIDDEEILVQRHNKIKELVEYAIASYIKEYNVEIEQTMSLAKRVFDKKQYRFCGEIYGDVIILIVRETRINNIYRMCGRIIEEVITIGDNRPVEKVIGEEELAKQLTSY